jgi:hypothetical protein
MEFNEVIEIYKIMRRNSECGHGAYGRVMIVEMKAWERFERFVLAYQLGEVENAQVNTD